VEFIRAITHFGVTPRLGSFKKKPGYCKSCGAKWTAREEKQSDVNIAAYLIHHSHMNQFDKALVITADSDLCPAIQLILDSHADKEIVILVPPNRYKITRELRGMVTAQKIKQKHLKKTSCRISSGIKQPVKSWLHDPKNTIDNICMHEDRSQTRGL